MYGCEYMGEMPSMGEIMRDHGRNRETMSTSAKFNRRNRPLATVRRLADIHHLFKRCSGLSFRLRRIWRLLDIVLVWCI